MFTRRNLLILNGVLALALAIACLSTAMSFVKRPEKEQEIKAVRVVMIEEETVERAPLEDYEIITTKNFFDAKLIKEKAPAPPAPPPPLKWKLRGTQKIGGKWSAYIELTTTSTVPAPQSTRKGRGRRRPRPKTKKETITVYEGDQILEYNVDILEIGKGYIKYQRTHNGEKLLPDYLYLEATSTDLFAKKQTYDSVIKPVPNKRNEYNVSRLGLNKEISDLQQLLGLVQLNSLGAPSADGKTGGLEIVKSENQTLLGAFGIEEKDVIVKIDELAIETTANLLEALSAAGKKSDFGVQIRRGKNRIQITYHLTH